MLTRNNFRIILFFLILSVCPLLEASADEPFSFSTQWTHTDSPNPQSLVVLWMTPQKGYYTYANKKIIGVFPTTISFLPDEGSAVPPTILYPKGIIKKDPLDPTLNVEIYEGETPVFLLFPSDQKPHGTIQISMLACSSENCTPLRMTIPLNLEAPATNQQSWYPKFLAAHENLQQQAKQASVEQATQASSGQHPTSTASGKMQFTPRPLQKSLEVTSLAKAMLFGLLAGLILNIMPCVLPVITLKISSLLIGGGTPAQRKQAFREHNIFFGLGILVWFLVLGLFLGLIDMTWGQLFQNNWLILVLTIVIFALALSLFDVFHLPVLDLKTGQSQNPKLQAFSSGLLATLLATPCSGPLLGGVLGFSLTQGLVVMMTIFFSMGFGMAMPYFFLAMYPELSNRLPRSGAWMLTMERILGFFLLGTVIYLLSILPDAMIIDALILLLSVALAAFIWGKWGGLHSSGLKKICIAGLSLLMIAGSTFLLFRPDTEQNLWENFNTQTFYDSLGTETLLLEFTADWCPTCKALEKTVLIPDHLIKLKNNYNIRLIRVDMTQNEEDKQALLRQMDSVSIPLLAVFPKGEHSRSPVILRDIYTQKQMEEAIQMAISEE